MVPSSFVKHRNESSFKQNWVSYPMILWINCDLLCVHTSDVSIMMSISMGNDCHSKNDATLLHLLRILSIGKKSEKQFLPIFIWSSIWDFEYKTFIGLKIAQFYLKCFYLKQKTVFFPLKVWFIFLYKLMES